MHNHDVIRRLGAFEELFWRMDQVIPKHFALVAEISGITSSHQWSAALAAAQRRHPLLNVYIRMAAATGLCFHRATGKAIPIRVVEANEETSWESEIERELSSPFDPEMAPLVRVVLIHHQKGTVFILVSHHSIADALGLVSVIRDVLISLSGQALEQLPLTPSQEELCGIRRDAWNFHEGTYPLEQSRALEDHTKARFNGTHLSVQKLGLSPKETTILIERTRLEATTLQGTLSTALALAGRRLTNSWCLSPVRILTPVSTRALVGLNDHSTLAMLTPIISVGPETGEKFWDIARKSGRQLTDLKSAEYATSGMQALTQALAQGLNGRTALLSSMHKAILTNIGRLSFETQFGGLRLEALWGPFVITRGGSTQTIGVATSNGAIRLVNSSQQPMPALLETMRDVLLTACTAAGES